MGDITDALPSFVSMPGSPHLHLWAGHGTVCAATVAQEEKKRIFFSSHYTENIHRPGGGSAPSGCSFSHAATVDQPNLHGEGNQRNPCGRWERMLTQPRKGLLWLGTRPSYCKEKCYPAVFTMFLASNHAALRRCYVTKNNGPWFKLRHVNSCIILLVYF